MLSAGGAIFHRPKDRAVHADNAHKNFWAKGGDHLTLMGGFVNWYLLIEVSQEIIKSILMNFHVNLYAFW